MYILSALCALLLAATVTTANPIIAYRSPTVDDPPAASSSSPAKFTPGWCGMHVTQYQKNEEGGDNPHSPNYVIRVSIFDADQKSLVFYDCNDCGTESQTVALDNVGNSFKTDLPVLMIITVGATDADPIEFAYGDQFWNSDSESHHSKFGAYDAGRGKVILDSLARWTKRLRRTSDLTQFVGCQF